MPIAFPGLMGMGIMGKQILMGSAVTERLDAI
jgi:hypothetical protein